MKIKILTKAATIFFLVMAACAFLAAPAAKAATPEQIQTAIDNGLAWLVSQQNVDGSWGDDPDDGERIGYTGLALVKLEDRAFETGFDSPFDEGYEYRENVIAGLNYLFTKVASDGCGTHFSANHHDSYHTGIAMMAIANSGNMSRVITVGPKTGFTYGAVLAENVSYLANSQDTTIGYEGAWGYGCGSNSDQSNAGYVVLGLQYAEAAGVAIPQVIKDQLSLWIDIVQCPDGGSKYTPAWDFEDPCYWENSLKTGVLLSELAFIGEQKDSVRAIAALGYIAAHWYDTDWIDGWGYSLPVAQYHAMYTLMKGLESMGVMDDEVPGVTNWFQDLADAIVTQQEAAGNWPDSPAYVWPEDPITPPRMSGILLSTLWNLLTLERVAPPPPVIEVSVDIKPGSCPNPLNTKGGGVLPLAILGTEDFDPTIIDPLTIKLNITEDGPQFGPPIRSDIEDVGTPFEGELCDCHDLNGDGFLDLTLKFDKKTLIVALSLNKISLNQETIPVTLTGNLRESAGGTPIIGEDCIWILHADVDGDLVPDAIDNCPNVVNSQQLDADSDGVGDCCDATPGCGGCGDPACE